MALCDICKKNEATIHIQEVTEDGKTKLNLCEECAAKQQSGALEANHIGEVLMSLKQLAGSLETLHKESELDSGSRREVGPECAHCGWNLKKLKESGGRLGCARCYQVFQQVIETALENVQRGKIHTGKRPLHAEPESEALRGAKLIHLEKQLKAAIQKEEYEEAAIIRDQIGAIKGNLTQKASAPRKDGKNGK